MAAVTVDRSEALGVNLSVLQRIDKDIIEIMATASHVALYAYDPAAQTWEKRNVEGAFFFVKRGAAPTYRMLITNRLNPTIFVQDVTTDVQFQFKKPYLMWKQKPSADSAASGAGEAISSIWFHSEEDLKAVGKVLAAILKGEGSKAPAPAPAPAPAAAPAMPVQQQLGGLSISSSTSSSSSGGLTSSASSNSLTPSVAAFFNAFASASGNTPQATAATGGAGGTGASDGSSRGSAATNAASSGSSSLGLGLGSSLLAAVPNAAGGAGGSSNGGLGEVSIMLSKKQLQALLMDLLATDDEFVSSLHRKYLEGVTRRAMQQ